jgi:hypothetical protein
MRACLRERIEPAESNGTICCELDGPALDRCFERPQLEFAFITPESTNPILVASTYSDETDADEGNDRVTASGDCRSLMPPRRWPMHLCALASKKTASFALV